MSSNGYRRTDGWKVEVLVVMSMLTVKCEKNELLLEAVTGWEGGKTKEW